MLREVANWFCLRSRDAVRSSWISLSPDKPCARSVRDKQQDGFEEAGGDRKTVVRKSGAASKGGKLF